MSTRKRSRGRGGPPRAALPAAAALPLYRYSVGLFVGFSLAALVAFWPSYFSRLGSQPTYHPHAHGLAMAAWCGLLVAQALLIRSGNRGVHRSLGATSYALVPVMVLTTINFVHFRVQGAPALGSTGLYFLALVVNALVAFVLLWGLAMYHRRQPAVHARYMIATIFPLFTPVTDRLIGAHLPGLVPLVPRIDGMPVLPFAGFVLADLMLAGLSIWDWRANRRAVFPVALGIVLLYHASVMTFHRLPLWDAFGAWFVTLPLS